MPPVSDGKKANNAKWDRANMSTLSTHVRKDYAERVKAKAAAQGKSVHQIIRAALDAFLDDDAGTRSGT